MLFHDLSLRISERRSVLPINLNIHADKKHTRNDDIKRLLILLLAKIQNHGVGYFIDIACSEILLQHREKIRPGRAQISKQLKTKSTSEQ